MLYENIKKIIKIYFVITSFFLFLHGEIVTPDLEYQKITTVGYAWKTVNLSNTYSDAIIVCTNVLLTNANNEAVVRIRNISSNDFQIKIQRPNDSDPGYVTDVYCIISDEGNYSIPFNYEAHKVVSNNTNGLTSPNDWSEARAENVSTSIMQTYTRPVVLGQVMSYVDNRFSVFWSFDCDNRGNRPFQSGMSDGICIGKHVGQIAQTRNNETLGYIVAEAGIYELGDFSIAVNYGGNSIRGIGNNPPYTYILDKTYTHGVVTKLAENGGQGGWAVLYGTSPIGTTLDMGIDEETVQGDTGRGHIAEEVAYWAMLSIDADLVTSKTVDNNTSLVGDSVTFTITVTNNGPSTATNISLTDSLPSGITYTGHTVSQGSYTLGTGEWNIKYLNEWICCRTQPYRNS